MISPAFECPCGVTHEITVATVVHALGDDDADARRKRRALLRRNSAFKQKARIYCECCRRLEMLFKHADGRR